MKRAVLAACIALISCTVESPAGVLNVTMDYYGQVGQTAVFRGRVTDPNIVTISRITITDPNSGLGGDEVLSGMDIDFVIIDRDGNMATTNDQFRPWTTSDTYVTPGWKRTHPKSPYTPTASHPGQLFGLLTDNSIDSNTATLGRCDGSYVYGNISIDTCSGWVSLGFAGQLSAAYSNTAVPSDGTYIFVGDVSPKDDTPQVTVQIDVPTEVVTVPVTGSGGGPYRVGIGGVFVLNGPAGSGNILSWNWDLDEDGVYDDASGRTQAFSYEYLVNELGLPSALDVTVEVTTTGGVSYYSTQLGFGPLPEPSTLLLLGLGAGLLRRRRR